MKRNMLLAGSLLFFAVTVRAQNEFGEVSFANTGAPAAQSAFLRGLALLHDFEYPLAATSFQEAEKIDPDFVMAYWGEAMTHNHPVWFQQDLNAARAVLGRLGPTPAARASRAKSERERAYLQTIEVLYRDGSKNERDDRYAEAMAGLHTRYPDDVDATAFYALSILGTSHNGRDLAKYMRAAALLEDVFPTHQRHPGVVHYLIHSYDDPVHAPLGMRAARLYGAIAPKAGHALHMTSHIFIALGMWDDVIDANRRAIAVVEAQRAQRGVPPLHCGHYDTWLHYALIQEHRVEEANSLLQSCRADALNPGFQAASPMDKPEGRINSYVEMVANQAMSGGAVDRLDRESVLAEKYADAKFTLAYVEAFDAARRGDAEGLRTAATKLHSLQKAAAGHVDPMQTDNPNYLQRLAVILAQIDALQLASAGHRDEAITALRKAAADELSMPFEFGPPAIEKPTLELLGDELLAAKQSTAAIQAYRDALLRAPGRTSILEGLRRAGTGAPVANAH